VATIEVGVEVKILAKAMIKQIDRVTGDLVKQVNEFNSKQSHPICIAVVGINYAALAVGYEGERQTITDGRTNRHPLQEAAEAKRRLRRDAQPSYDEFIVLHYIATNQEPFELAWLNSSKTQQEYGSALLRISREYDQRFAR